MSLSNKNRLILEYVEIAVNSLLFVNTQVHFGIFCSKELNLNTQKRLEYAEILYTGELLTKILTELCSLPSEMQIDWKLEEIGVCFDVAVKWTYHGILFIGFQ